MPSPRRGGLIKRPSAEVTLGAGLMYYGQRPLHCRRPSVARLIITSCNVYIMLTFDWLNVLGIILLANVHYGPCGALHVRPSLNKTKKLSFQG